MPYADVFVRNGIAVLIHDKRGTGSSTGNWARATFDDLADDALAGVKLLKGRPEINPAQIGLQGTSLGGWVAPLAASRSSDVAFVIVESAPALTPLEHEKLRVRSQLRADGFAPQVMMQALAFMDQKFEVARTGKGWERLQASMTRNAQTGWISYVNRANVIGKSAMALGQRVVLRPAAGAGEADVSGARALRRARHDRAGGREQEADGGGAEAVGHARHDDQGVRARESRLLRGDQRRPPRGGEPEGAWCPATSIRASPGCGSASTCPRRRRSCRWRPRRSPACRRAKNQPPRWAARVIPPADSRGSWPAADPRR